MLDSHKYFGRRGLPALLFLALAALGCRGVTGDGHIRPASMEVSVTGATVVEATSSESTGSIAVPAGSSVQASIVFLDLQGQPIPVGPDHFVRVEMASAVAEFEPVDSPTGSGQIHGLVVGSTTATVRLMHGRIGGRSHADWTAAPFTVNVSE